MNSDVTSDADAPASAQISEGRVRKEIRDIIEQSWASLARSLADDFPNELNRVIQRSIDEAFTRHLSGVIRPDLLERIKSECIQRILDFLSQALRDGLLNRHQDQLRAHIDDFLDEEFAEKLVHPKRRRAVDERSGAERGPTPAEAPAAGAAATEIESAKEATRHTIDVGGTLAGGLPRPAPPQATPATPAPTPAPAPAPGAGYAPAPVPADAARDVLEVERGKLVEKIPRTMYLGVREIIEVRLGLPTEDLTAGLAGGGVLTEHGVWMVETMSIKLLSPDGAFNIEARSPETQLVKNDVLKGSPLEGLVANFGQWIWTVTPKVRGSHPLELNISASVRDARGLPGSATLPNQTIPIEVAISLTVTSRRLLWWILSAGVSGAVTTLVGVITRDYWWPVLKSWLSLP
jgi:hypothetical protein